MGFRFQVLQIFIVTCVENKHQYNRCMVSIHGKALEGTVSLRFVKMTILHCKCKYQGGDSGLPERQICHLKCS